MQDSARFFAYSTWVVMVSLGIMIFTHQFQFLAENSLPWLFIWFLAFGFLYFNLTFAAVKRFIKKVPAPTNSHIALSVLIFLPPFIWIITITDTLTAINILTILILAGSISLGTVIGNKSGIKARYEYVQTLKKHQKKQ